MNWIHYPDLVTVREAITAGEPLLVLVSFDGENGIVSHVDDGVEDHLLLERVGKDSRDIDHYFRLVADHEGADWTFICPPDYRGIPDKTRRIAAFYKDGFSTIPKALMNLGLSSEMQIPKRYRRHMEFPSGE